MNDRRKAEYRRAWTHGFVSCMMLLVLIFFALPHLVRLGK